MIARDTIDIEPAGSGSRVACTADFEFHGGPSTSLLFSRRPFEEQGGEAEEGLRDALAQL